MLHSYFTLSLSNWNEQFTVFARLVLTYEVMVLQSATFSELFIDFVSVKCIILSVFLLSSLRQCYTLYIFK